MNINFWHNHLLDANQSIDNTIKLPPTAKIQLGDKNVYPWAKECEHQIEEMGPKALARHLPSLHRPAATPERILEAIESLRKLIIHDVEPIAFQARRKPLRTYNGLEHRHLERIEAILDACVPGAAYQNGSDND